MAGRKTSAVRKRTSPEPDRPIRERILDAAVDLLIKQGAARTTTLEVQKRAEVSRGALLHYFPTHADLLAALIEDLVKRNEAAVQERVRKSPPGEGALERGVRTLAHLASQPSFLAELELWAIARTNPDLRAAIISAERRALGDHIRVMDGLFEGVDGVDGLSEIVALTVEFVRGLALSSILRGKPARRNAMISSWIEIVLNSSRCNSRLAGASPAATSGRSSSSS